MDADTTIAADTTFDATQTYTAPLTITSGASLTLGDGSAGSTVSLTTPSITDNGLLVIETNNTSTLSAPISGSGSLYLASGSTLVLTGANTYTGTTTINSGALLQIGSGGTTGSVAGNIIDNGSVIFNRTNDYTYSGTISGTGMVEIAHGIVYLTGMNTYTGGTTIDTGAVLALGTGGTTGSITGDVVDNGMLYFTRSDAITFAGDISGSGAVELTGGNAVTLTGSNSYTGYTFLEDSSTLIAGSSTAISANSTFYVDDGGTLALNNYDTTIKSISGSGTITLGSGDLTISSGGSFSGVISGTGALDVAGGTLILTGASTYIGGTTIDSGATLQIGNGGTTGSIISPIVDNGTLVFNRTDAITYSNVISGSGNVTITTGTLNLTGANTYTGTTTINSGAMLLLGNGSTSATTGSIVSDVVNNGTLEFNRSDSITYAGNISSSGDVSISAGGSVTFTGSNSYSGYTYITNGTLIAGSANALSSNSIISISSTGSLNLNGSNASVPALFGYGTVTLGSGTLTLTDSGSSNYAIYEYAGIISGTGGVTLSAGTLYLTGENTYTGTTTIASGASLYIGHDTTTGSVAGNIVDNGTLNFYRTDDITYSGTISGSGDVHKWGSGVMTLTGSNSYTGTTYIGGGTLRLGSETALPLTTAVTIYGTLDLNGYNSTINSLEGSGSVTLGSATLTLNNGGNYSGVISGTGGLSLSNNTLTLTGENTYTGTTTIASGTLLYIGNNGTTGSIAGNIIDNGTLRFYRSDDITYSGAISGSGELTKLGAGVLTLTGTNSYSGITEIANGTLRAGSTTALSAQSIITIDAGATLDLASYNSTISGLTGSGSVTLGSATLTLNNGGLYTGVISGTGGLSLGSGTLTLAGDNSYTGTTTIASGATLQLGVGGTTGSVAGNIANNGSLTFNRSNTLSYAAVVSGTGSLTVNSGMLILNGINTYTGATIVNAGTLQIGDKNHSTASIVSSVTVENDATLSGHGTIYGSVTAEDGATIKPGGSIGTLSISGNFVMASGSTLEVEMSGDQYSTVAVTGTAAIGGTLVIDADTDLTPGTTYTLVSASSVSGSFSSVEVSGLDSDTVYSLTATGTSLSLTSTSSAPSVSGLYSDLVTASFATLHTLNTTLLEHPQQEQAGIAAWATSFGHAATQEHTGDAQSFSTRGAGIIGGFDVRQESGFHYGIAAAFDQTALSVQSGGGKGLTNTAYFAANAGLTLAYGQVDGGLFYAFDKTGAYRDEMKSAPDSHSFGVMAQYSIRLDDVMPYARLSYVRLYRDATTEIGGSDNIAVAQRNYNSLRSDIGAQYSHDFDLGDAVKLTPEAGLGLSTELASSSRKAIAQLSSDTSSWIAPNYAKPDNFSYTARAGLTLKIDQDLAFSIYASGRKGKHGEEGMLGLNGSFRF